MLLLKEMGRAFIIFSVLSGTFIGVFSTSILRWYLKRKVSLEDFTVKELLKIATATLVTAFIFGSLNFGFGFAYGRLGPEMSDVELKILKAFDSLGLIIFSSLFNIIIWLSCYLVIKLLLRFNTSRIERLELNTNLKQAQLNTLKGQINPHFMFNSLNNIRGLMLEDVEKSREMLTKLSEMLRYSLTKNNIDGITLEEELEMVENYIDLSKIQFEDRLKFEKEIGANTLAVQIPPMLLQLLVENAAKHGISNLKEGGTISLSSQLNGEALYLQVRNTGKLSIAKESTQLGLKNIKQRLQLLYGNTASFHLKEEGNEVVADIKIPIQ
ncbi:MAG: histidine kinase [Bacteroidota bacterium]